MLHSVNAQAMEEVMYERLLSEVFLLCIIQTLFPGNDQIDVQVAS